MEFTGLIWTDSARDDPFLVQFLHRLYFVAEPDPVMQALTGKAVPVHIFFQIFSGVVSFEEFVLDVLFRRSIHSHV